MNPIARKRITALLGVASENGKNRTPLWRAITGAETNDLGACALGAEDAAAQPRSRGMCPGIYAACGAHRPNAMPVLCAWAHANRRGDAWAKTFA